MVRLPPDTARTLSAEALSRAVSVSDLACDLIASGPAGTEERSVQANRDGRMTAVDLFARAGGLGLGLNQAGFDPRCRASGNSGSGSV